MSRSSDSRRKRGRNGCVAEPISHMEPFEIDRQTGDQPDNQGIFDSRPSEKLKRGVDETHPFDPTGRCLSSRLETRRKWSTRFAIICGRSMHLYHKLHKRPLA
jgi:hypothetical protein